MSETQTKIRQTHVAQKGRARREGVVDELLWLRQTRSFDDLRTRRRNLWWRSSDRQRLGRYNFGCSIVVAVVAVAAGTGIFRGRRRRARLLLRNGASATASPASIDTASPPARACCGPTASTVCVPVIRAPPFPPSESRVLQRELAARDGLIHLTLLLLHARGARPPPFTLRDPRLNLLRRVEHDRRPLDRNRFPGRGQLCKREEGTTHPLRLGSASHSGFLLRFSQPGGKMRWRSIMCVSTVCGEPRNVQVLYVQRLFPDWYEGGFCGTAEL
jgi:hypothetical protein